VKRRNAGGHAIDRAPMTASTVSPEAWLTALCAVWLLEMKFSPEQIANRFGLKGSDHGGQP